MQRSSLISELRAAFCDSGGERGVVLVTALLVMLLLSPLGAIFLTASLTETTIASNQVKSSKAFNLAEAGVAVAKQTLRGSADWDVELAAAQPFACPSFASGGVAT